MNIICLYMMSTHFYKSEKAFAVNEAIIYVTIENTQVSYNVLKSSFKQNNQTSNKR